MNAKTLEAIKRHGESLLAAFPNATERDPVALCKKLRRIETATHSVMTDYCNGDCDQMATDHAEARALERLGKLLKLGNDNPKCMVFINRDPRGLSCKLDDKWTANYNRVMYRDHGNGCTLPIQTDMGGYGLLAPDLNQ